MKFKRYDTPRKGFFRVPHPDNSYSFEDGWKQKIKQCIIIGEDDQRYITEIKTSRWGERINDKVIRSTHKIPLGIHKTRLIQWMDGQLIISLP